MKLAIRLLGFLFLIQFSYRVGRVVGRQFTSGTGISFAEVGAAVDANLVLLAVALIAFFVTRQSRP